MNQRTIRERVSFEGVGIHSGEFSKIVIHPERENTGIRFLKDGVYVPAYYTFVVNTDHSTDIGKDGVVIKTVEHLMAVFYMLGIDNATVEFIEGFEVPILDGSGEVFYKELKNKVIDLKEPKKVLRISNTIEARNCKAHIRAMPYPEFSAVYVGSLDGFFEELSVEYKGDAEEIVFARTFCFDYELEYLIKKGLAKGGSLKNAVLLGKGFVYNEEGLRSQDEPIRHKLLDLIGDLALLGAKIEGRIISYRGGHSLNHAFLKELLRTSSTSLASSSVSTP